MPLSLLRPAARTTRALALVVLLGCGPVIPSPSPVVTAPPTPPRATPTFVPTPVPTPTATPAGPGQVTLVVRVTMCTEICEPSAGTTVLDDGRMIWNAPDGRTVEARLTPAGLRRVVDEIRGRGELATSGSYQAVLRPGAEPFPRGTTAYTFEVGGEPVIVVSGDPRDYEVETELWLIPAEMERLARLARRLLEPLAWLGPASLATPASRFQPDRYVVLVELFPDIGQLPGLSADVADVAWPFGVRLETVGRLLSPPDDPFPVRCLVADADTARRLAAAETAAGVERSADAWSSTISYAWRETDGFALVTLGQVLPHQHDPCGALRPS